MVAPDANCIHPSELDSLQISMNQALDAIRTELRTHQLPELSNYALESHILDDPSYLCPPRLYEARRLALAAIGQLKTLLQNPFEKVVEASYAVYDSASLDILANAGVIEWVVDPTSTDTANIRSTIAFSASRKIWRMA